MQVPTLDQLMESGAYYGHRKALTHPSFERMVHTIKDGVYIIDLEKTQKQLEESAKFMSSLVNADKKILFVGTKKQLKDQVLEIAQKLNMPFVNYRWLGGMLTNFSTIKRRINDYVELEKEVADKDFESKYIKKEKARIKKELTKLNRFFEGLKDLKDQPDALFVVDPKEDKVAILEAKRMNIPVIAICNTNVNIGNIDYPIPANDNSLKTVSLLLEYFGSIEKSSKK